MEHHPRIEGYDVPDDFVFPGAPYMDLLGLRLDLISPDRVEAHLEVRPELHQPYGLVHGGVYTAIVETLGSVGGAMRVMADGRALVGVHNSTDFVRSVREGTIHAVATPVHPGRSTQLWAVECHDDEGRLLARGQLRGQVVDPQRVQ